jgi:hypothetical protein
VGDAGFFVAGDDADFFAGDAVFAADLAMAR